MEFRVLGSVEVRHDDRIEVLSGRLQRTLLGVLLARADQPVPVDVLTDALWGGLPDTRAPQKLQLHVHRLRRVFDDPDRLSFDATGYRLRARPDEIDAERFDELVGAGTAAVEHEPQRAIESLRAALALWRGVPFADSEVPLLVNWARRLTERRLTAMESLYQAELACGLHDAVIGALFDLVREHPLRERSYELLMTALYRAGRQSEALEVYSRARQALVSELGLEPGPELRDLQRRVLAGDLPVRTAGTRHREVPAQLPVDVRGFVGREDELAELNGLEAPVRICAVTGTAGVGKTALAVRWAHAVRDRFPDGQLYVDLHGYGREAPVSAADALAGFLRSLGLDATAIPENLDERAATFRTLVDQRRVLILLDNARSVEQVRPLLPAGPSCFTLVTSRDSLAGLVARHGAHRIGLDRFSPVDAVGLLRELLGTRAESEPAAVGVLAERCARLPLALRVTAELVRSRPGRLLGDLVDELADQQDALDLMDVDGDPHTAVRVVFSWSYQQLSPQVARVFRLFGPHPGHDVDAYAVAAMAGAGLRETRRALDVLVRAHLVDQPSAGRYQPHDLLRAYAAELAETTDDSSERAAALTRLTDYYLATAAAAMDLIAPHEAAHRPEVAAPDIETPGLHTYEAALDWLAAERVNMLAATQRAEPGKVITMSDTVWRYLNMAGYRDDAVELHTRALRAAQDLGDTAAEANARRVLAIALRWTGRTSAAMDHLERALDLYERVGDRWLRAATMNNLGNMHRVRGNLAAAADRFRHALALFDELGDQRMSAPAMDNLAQLLSTLGHHDEARRLFERGLAVARDSGDQGTEVSMLCGLAQVHVRTGRYRPALDRARQALTIARTTGHRSIESCAMRILGAAHCGLGEHEVGTRCLHSAVRIARAVGDVDDIVPSLGELAAGHATAGNLTEALRYYHEALAENGQALREDYAYVHAGMAGIHARLGEVHQAREHWQRALEIYRELGMPHADEVAAKLGSLAAPVEHGPHVAGNRQR